MIKHVEFGRLLYEKLISDKLYTVISVARKTGTPASTIYKYCEGALVVPAEFVSMVYNATGDIDFLNFVIDDTDQALVARERGRGDKSVLEETLDVASACGHLVGGVQRAMADKRLIPAERKGIEKAINKAEAELEDLRERIKR